jgi:hypothetical protein
MTAKKFLSIMAISGLVIPNLYAQTQPSVRRRGNSTN